MNFQFTPRLGPVCLSEEGRTFTIERLWKQEADDVIDVSHLVDRTYEYRSARELRWHLADRFAAPKHEVRLDRI